MFAENITEKLKSLPDDPGIYIMKNINGEILYIGKAISLKNRVRQYFHKSSLHSERISSMIKNIADFEIIITDSELEALILECSLIKKHKPRYNVLLKDDKSFSYIKITIEEEYPRILFARKIEQDKSRYFGPYLRAGDVKETLELIRKIFPLRSCNRKIGKLFKSRPCLYYHLGQCLGLCNGDIDKTEYASLVDQVVTLLEGKYETLLNELKSKMHFAAELLEFEKAAIYRNQFNSLQNIMQKQKIVSTDLFDLDCIACLKKGDETVAQMLYIRNGALINAQQFIFEKIESDEMGEIIESFIKQFYQTSTFIPEKILIQENIGDVKTISSWLSNIKKKQVKIVVPKKGEKRKLIDMALRNAEQFLQTILQQKETLDKKSTFALEQLAGYLLLEDAPKRIEAFDISNLQGSNSVGSMVVFEEGNPSFKEYRRFKIRGLNNKPDDYASIAQIVERRFTNALEEMKNNERQDSDVLTKFSKMPDLVLIDGGKGQLSAAKSVLDRLGLTYIPIIGLAEEFEQVFVPDKEYPLNIPSNSEALFLLQRIRDEAHRFAITYHKSLRKNQLKSSVLEEVPNIGKKRRIALYRHFGSLEAIKKATIEDLVSVKGMTKESAKSLLEYFR